MDIRTVSFETSLGIFTLSSKTFKI